MKGKFPLGRIFDLSSLTVLKVVFFMKDFSLSVGPLLIMKNIYEDTNTFLAT